MPDKTAHVICMNDSVEHVFIGELSSADQMLDDLARSHFSQNETIWVSNWHQDYPDKQARSFCGIPQTAYGYYRDRIYWHIHTVGLTDEI